MPHLTTDQIREYLAGGASDVAAIEDHILACPACANLLRKTCVGNIPLAELLETTQPGIPRSAEKNDFVSAATFDSPDRLLSDRADEQPVKTASSGESGEAQESRYRIVDELGRGGMGIVYRAFDSQLKREVALKVVLHQQHASDKEQRRFQIEAETVAKLKHPRIVQIYEIATHDGCPCMALELIDGASLQCKDDGEIRDPIWSVLMLLQIAETVQAAHEQGVVHRDLKPENILVVRATDSQSDAESATDNSDGSSTGRWWKGPSRSSFNDAELPQVPIAKITDFGLARTDTDDSGLTASGALLGTPKYMAPEQARGESKNAGPAVDIHALGAILYEMLVGYAPFEADDLNRTIARVIHDDPVPPRMLNAQVHGDLETICLKCLMKSPDDRYASAQELVDDLQLFLAGEPIKSRRLSLFRRVTRWARAKPLLASTYAVLSLMIPLHLFALYVLKIEANERIDSTLKVVLPLLLVGIHACQWLMNSDRFRELGRITFVSLMVVGITGVLTLDSGPQSAPVPMYSVTIIISAVVRPRISLVWITTLMAIIGYGWLNIFAYYFRPEFTVRPDNAGGVIICLIVTGIVTSLLIKRNQTLQ
jgi:eukaryotic-like serine/threonine-protein kinase